MKKKLQQICSTEAMPFIVGVAAVFIIGAAVLGGDALKRNAEHRTANIERRTPGFEDGVRYGLLFARREPFEDSLPRVTAGARDLWQVYEADKGTNTLSDAYRRLFPKSTFEEGVEYGAGFALLAVQKNATNLTMENIKAAAFAQKVRSTETNAPTRR